MLTLEQTRKAAPAAFAIQPAKHVSEKYNFIPTIEIVEKMMDMGWAIQSAQQQKARKSNPNFQEKLEAGKHKIVLRPLSIAAGKPELGSILPTITLVNSHDWSSRMEGYLGMLRLVCTNGMTANCGEFVSYSIRHDHAMMDIQRLSDEFSAKSQNMIETVESWNSTLLSNDSVREFGYEAAMLRYGKADEHLAAAMTATRRYEDQTNTLWNVFNRAQENGMKGGMRYGTMARATRALSNIGRGIDFNNDLFALAADWFSEITTGSR